MANKKLFEDFLLATPSDSDRLAFGREGEDYRNITVGDFRTVMVGESTLNTLVFEIGAWNMNTTTSPAAINMLISDEGIINQYIPRSKVRGVSVMIVSDNGLAFADFLSVQNGTASLYPQIQLGGFFWTTWVSLNRRSGSHFDSGNYEKTANPDTTPYNRGWVTVTYEE